jgi:hypothetical protein
MKNLVGKYFVKTVGGEKLEGEKDGDKVYGPKLR